MLANNIRPVAEIACKCKSMKFINSNVLSDNCETLKQPC